MRNPIDKALWWIVGPFCIVAMIVAAQPAPVHQSAVTRPRINKSVAIMMPIPGVSNACVFVYPDGKQAVKSPIGAWPLELLAEMRRTNSHNCDIIVYQ